MYRKNNRKYGDSDQAVLFGALLDYADDLVFATDADLRLVYVNRRLQDALAAVSVPLLGRTIPEIGLFGSHAQPLHERLCSSVANAEPSQFDIDWVQDDELRHFRVLVQVDLHGDSVRHLIACARDISRQRRVENDLRDREREFRTLAENSPDNIIRYGLDKRAIYCNREIKERVTTTAQRIVGRTPIEAAPPGMEGAEVYERQLERTLATGERGLVELIVPHPSGEFRVHSIVIAAEYDPRGAVCGAVAVGRDVTEQVQAQQALLTKEREFRTLAENAGDNIVRWDTGCRMVYVNPAMANLFGVSADALVGRVARETERGPDLQAEAVERMVRDVLREGREAMLEIRVRPHGSERSRVHQVRFVPERDESGQVCSVLGFGRDITEKLEHLELIESLVRTDPLTRLANRRALQERAPGMLKAAGRRGTRVAVMLLDLDQFKSVNDGMGHGAGDEMLCEVARRLSSCLRDNDLLVRLGGDEFVLVAPDIENTRALGMIVAKLHVSLAPPLHLGNRDLHTTASIGVAVYPSDGEQFEDLLAHADTAMYQAKRAGRARTEYYRSELGDAVRHRLALEDALHEASNGAGLELYFQPQLDILEPRRVIGAEALLRWRHPILGFLTPGDFIALAEETGAIVPIGRWVLRSAAEAAVRWNRDRTEPLHVSVNVSTRQFIDDDLPEVVDEVLVETGCDTRWLWIEITESALLDDSPRVQQTLEAFRLRGLRIALDDFGTGYSALNYLARFPVDCLKIDRSFVSGIGSSSRGDELVKAFIAMATALNLTTVAEGVETDEQAAFLLAQNCTVAQGFRYGRPMHEASFVAEMLRETDSKV